MPPSLKPTTTMSLPTSPTGNPSTKSVASLDAILNEIRETRKELSEIRDLMDLHQNATTKAASTGRKGAVQTKVSSAAAAAESNTKAKPPPLPTLPSFLSKYFVDNTTAYEMATGRIAIIKSVWPLEAFDVGLSTEEPKTDKEKTAQRKKVASVIWSKISGPKDQRRGLLKNLQRDLASQKEKTNLTPTDEADVDSSSDIPR